jgi:hypothetical protein
MVGCSVPRVEYYDASVGPDDARVGPSDASDEHDADVSTTTDAPTSDAPTSDAPVYCGPGLVPPPDGGCCSMSLVYYGGYNSKACQACVNAMCSWPNVCCLSGHNGICQMPPCH